MSSGISIQRSAFKVSGFQGQVAGCLAWARTATLVFGIGWVLVEFLSGGFYEFLEGLVRGQVGGVDFYGVFRAAEGGMGAVAVGCVSDFEVSGNSVQGYGLLFGLFGESPFRSLIGARIEEEFDVGVREDDGSDVTPFQNHPASCSNGTP